MSGERLLWTIVAGICALPTVARVLRPVLAESAGFLHLQQLSIGALVAIGVGATVVNMGRRVEFADNADPKLVARVADPAKVYRSQTIVACVVGLGVLLPLLVFAAKTGRFSEFGGWFIAPLILIGPGVLLREMVCGHPANPSPVDHEKQDRS
jgi:hypothetical protein